MHRICLHSALPGGESPLNGFRNHDLRAKLRSDPTHNRIEAGHRTQRSSHLIAKLHGHGPIAKFRNSRLDRVTDNGVKAAWSAVRCPGIDFPAPFSVFHRP